MNTLLKSAIILLALSLIAFVWGLSYTQSHRYAPLEGLFGKPNPTYEAAQWSTTLGVIGFLIGIGLLIGGLVQRKQPSRNGNHSSQTKPRQSRLYESPGNIRESQKCCRKCGKPLSPDSERCASCGTSV